MNTNVVNIKNHFVNLMQQDFFMRKTLINTITNNSIRFLALMSIPLNIIVYMALRESEYLIPRFVVPFLSLIIIVFAVFNQKFSFKTKIQVLRLIFFSGAIFTLLLGLLDMASLWFILTIIYTLFVSQKKEALYLFLAGFLLIAITGFLLVTKISFIPLKYNFEKCHYACVITRVIHYLMIGSLIYYIIRSFIQEINQNIEELKEKAAELQNANQQLKNEMEAKKEIQKKMLEAVILTEERERKRIAADLHDGLGPVLSSVNLYYQAYIDENDKQKKSEIELKLKKIIKNAIDDISKISHNISPNILEDNGLIIALENFINQLSIKKDLEISFTYDNIQRFDIKKELVLYRAVTELINNSLKYAKARLISIHIKKIQGFLVINYADDGIGFDKEKVLRKSTGNGLTNIRNRMQSLEGIFSFESSENQGFQASLQMPCH